MEVEIGKDETEDGPSGPDKSVKGRRVNRPGVRGRFTRRRVAVLVALMGLAGTLFGVGVAQADLPTAWTQTITTPANGSANGLLITGPTSGLVNLFEIKDGFDQPIAAVGNDGGLKVFGDDLGVYGARGGVFLPEVYFTPDTITAGAACPLANQVAISGQDGSFWRCHATLLKWNRIL
jgi:hypothetical protein